MIVHVAVETDGTPEGTKLVDAKTGEEIKFVGLVSGRVWSHVQGNPNAKDQAGRPAPPVMLPSPGAEVVVRLAPVVNIKGEPAGFEHQGRIAAAEA